MSHWAFDAVFYHVYPLGLTGAPERNDFTAPPVARLDQLLGWIPHLQDLGANALYLGPLFESTAHGYDTADYYHVDRRLGTDETLKHFSSRLHAGGIRLVLDGVFHHVGRDFWAFCDLLTNGEQSPYRDWFANLRFDGRSPYGDPFQYEAWAGHFDLVKLNLHNPGVKEHLFGAVAHWIGAFDVDGLRLDAADAMDLGFLRELAASARSRRPDFWLMGEVVHGDYRGWANPQTLDSVTNYECYKGLYSSLVDVNYFEIAYALARQFGDGGLYRGLPLYNFVDNHDVNRVASNLKKAEHLYPLYLLLFTMPGVPSVYYGSEWGLRGKRGSHDDRALRPALTPAQARENAPAPELAEVIGRLARLRRGSAVLCHGDYRQLYVSHEQLAFARRADGQQVVVLLNAADRPAAFDIRLNDAGARELVDLLNPQDRFATANGRLRVPKVWPHWGRVLAPRA